MEARLLQGHIRDITLVRWRNVGRIRMVAMVLPEPGNRLG
jgi:hypothetical protein